MNQGSSTSPLPIYKDEDRTPGAGSQECCEGSDQVKMDVGGDHVPPGAPPWVKVKVLPVLKREEVKEAACM